MPARSSPALPGTASAKKEALEERGDPCRHDADRDRSARGRAHHLTSKAVDAPSATGGSATVRQDAAAVAWWVLVGAGSGAIAGALVGGIGGRLAMLLLRLTSPDAVTGMISDDGFEIGVVSFDTAQLVLAMAMLGAINGVLYAALRNAIPAELRLPLWTFFAAVLGGASVVHEDGVDFTLLEPAALASRSSLLLPGAAAAVVVLLVERWSARRAVGRPAALFRALHRRARRNLRARLRRTARGCALVARRGRLAGPAARVARVAVPPALAIVRRSPDGSSSTDRPHPLTQGVAPAARISSPCRRGPRTTSSAVSSG